jgi:hypothetical protein
VQLVVYYYYIKSHLLKEVKMKEKKKDKTSGILVNLQPLGQSDASLSLVVTPYNILQVNLIRVTFLKVKKLLRTYVTPE